MTECHLPRHYTWPVAQNEYVHILLREILNMRLEYSSAERVAGLKTAALETALFGVGILFAVK